MRPKILTVLPTQTFRQNSDGEREQLVDIIVHNPCHLPQGIHKVWKNLSRAEKPLKTRLRSILTIDGRGKRFKAQELIALLSEYSPQEIQKFASEVGDEPIGTKPPTP